MSISNPILHELLDPIGECLTPEVAGRIIGLRASQAVQRRVEALAERSALGTLTAAERAEYEAYVAASTFIAVLQSKARKLVDASSR